MIGNNYRSELGLPRIINASGTLTSFGGSRVRPEAAAAMAEASGSFFDMELLLKKSGERIAGLLGVDASLITAGASPGIIQSIAACIAGIDPYLRNLLPSSPPARSEVIVQRSHRNPYDNAVPTAGATFIEIGDCIKTHPWELESSITERTAAVFFTLQAEMLNASLSLDETIRIAHAKDVPVVVDAAAELPPKSNLWTLRQRGADLVIFSGGKEIGGPQSSGLVVGSRRLVDAARYNGAPNYGVGRPAKAGKENVLGFLAAFEAYLAEDEKLRMDRMKEKCAFWMRKFGELESVEITPYTATQPGMNPICIPKVFVRKPGVQVASEVLRLRNSTPSVIVDSWRDGFVLSPQTLLEGEEEEVFAALSPLLKTAQ